MVIQTKPNHPKVFQSPKLTFQKQPPPPPPSMNTSLVLTKEKREAGSLAKRSGRHVQVHLCEKLSTDPDSVARLYDAIESWQEAPTFQGPNLLFLEHFAPFLEPGHYGYTAVPERFVTESPMMYATEDDSIFGVLQLKKFDLEQSDFNSIVDVMTTYCPKCGCLEIEKDVDDGVCTCWECDHEFPIPETLSQKEGATPPKPGSIEISRVLSKAVARLDSRSYKAFGIMLGRVCEYAKRFDIPLLSLNPLDDSLEALYARFGFKRVGLTCYGNRDICAQRAREYIAKHRIHVESSI